MPNAKVDAEAHRADLRISQKPIPSDYIGDIFLKRRVRILASRHAVIQSAILGEFKKSLENAWPFRRRAAQIDIAWIEGGENFAADTGTSEEHI